MCACVRWASAVHFARCALDLHKAIRPISTGVRLDYLMYHHFENSNYYKTMRSLGKFKLLESNAVDERGPESSAERVDELVGRDWSAASPRELCEAFAALSEYAKSNSARIASPRFDAFVDALADRMNEMDDASLRKVCSSLTEWPETPSVFTRNFVEVWAALDDAFLSRIDRWDVDEMLLHSDAVYVLNITRKSDYMTKALLRLGRRVKQLTPEQFVQMMFYMLNNRRKSTHAMELQTQFLRLFDTFSMEEISIICAGFFKMDIPLRNVCLVQKLIDKVILGASTINGFVLSAIMKILKLSIKVPLENYKIMLDVLTPQIPKFNIMTCVQIATLPVKLNIYHQESLDLIIAKFLEDPKSARLKDIERLVLAATESKERREDLYECIVNELRQRIDEFEIYTKCFAVCLSYLTRVEVYPEDLLSKILDQENVNKKYNRGLYHDKQAKASHGKELLIIECGIESERPDYRGNRLDRAITLALAKYYGEFFPNERFNNYSIPERALNEIYMLLREMVGDEKYLKGMTVLPHYSRPGIVICFDDNNSPVDLSQFPILSTFGYVIKAPDTKHRWCFIALCGAFSKLYGSDESTIVTKTYSRQLSKIGYTPIFMFSSEWVKMTEDARKQFFKEQFGLDKSIKKAPTKTINIEKLIQN